MTPPLRCLCPRDEALGFLRELCMAWVIGQGEVEGTGAFGTASPTHEMGGGRSTGGAG